MSYATPGDLLKRFDYRDLGDLGSDDTTRIPPEDLENNARILTALEDASGDIDAALIVAGRYDPDDLAALTGNSLSHLKRVACDIAASYLMSTRLAQEPEKIEARIKVAEGHLERLRKGENIFNIQGAIDAGHEYADGPTTVELEQLNLIRDRVLHYYPGRRLPDNR